MIQVYSPKINNRIKYAFDLVLKQVCLFEYSIVSKKEELDFSKPIINYTGEKIDDSFFIQPYGLLYEKGVKPFDIKDIEYGGDYKVQFFRTGFGDVEFDIFSAAFFLTTRMEEYWKFEPDQHGRFTSENSLAKKLGFLHLPLINIWGKVFKEKIKLRYPELTTSNRKFEIINTIDIDNAWAFKHKSTGIQIGGSIKDIFKGNFSNLRRRLSVASGKIIDPYDTYDYIRETATKHNVNSIYFFLLGDRSEYDKNIPWKNKGLQQLILKLKEGPSNQIGLHPSYSSYLKPEQLIKEVNRIENITGKEINIARKHFLKLSIPDSYRNFEKAGLTDDYTMGYADHTGFRASICTPFTFFDVLQDKELKVKVHPFAYMDGTLNEYLQLTPKEAIQKIQQLKQAVQDVDGTFIGIWHNETLNDTGIWKGWKEVYEAGIINSFSQKP